MFHVEHGCQHCGHDKCRLSNDCQVGGDIRICCECGQYFDEQSKLNADQRDLYNCMNEAE